MSKRVLFNPNVQPPAPGSVPVTVLVPTKNEAKNLPRTLDHLRWAGEVVVADSSSTDATPDITRAYGAKYLDFKWNGQWPKKRNWVLRNAELKHEWVLMVDADEWIIPELANEIALAIQSKDKVGYWVNRKFIFMGRWLKHCGYYPSWNLRLIKRGCGEFEKLTDTDDKRAGDTEVHEHVLPTGPVGYLKSDMLHFAFPDIFTFVEKHNRYSSWEAAVQFEGKEKTNAIIGNATLSRRRWLKSASRRLPFRPTIRFLYSYFIQLGILDGRAGYTFCQLLALYEFLSVSKYHELRYKVEDDKYASTLSSVPEFDWKKNIGEERQ